MKMGAPRMGTGVVDVHDVALAHYKAGTTQSNGNNLLSSFSIFGIVTQIRRSLLFDSKMVSFDCFEM